MHRQDKNALVILSVYSKYHPVLESTASDKYYNVRDCRRSV